MHQHDSSRCLTKEDGLLSGVGDLVVDELIKRKRGHFALSGFRLASQPAKQGMGKETMPYGRRLVRILGGCTGRNNDLAVAADDAYLPTDGFHVVRATTGQNAARVAKVEPKKCSSALCLIEQRLNFGQRNSGRLVGRVVRDVSSRARWPRTRDPQCKQIRYQWMRH